MEKRGETQYTSNQKDRGRNYSGRSGNLPQAGYEEIPAHNQIRGRNGSELQIGLEAPVLISTCLFTLHDFYPPNNTLNSCTENV